MWGDWAQVFGGRVAVSEAEWCHVERPGGGYLIIATPDGYAAARRRFPQTCAFTRKELGLIAKYIERPDREAIFWAKRRLGGWVLRVIQHPHQPTLL